MYNKNPPAHLANPFFSIITPFVYQGSRNSSVVRAPDSWSKGHGFKSLQEWQENYLLQICVLTFILVSVPPSYHSSAQKDPSHSAKSEDGRLQLNTHTHDLCGFEWSDTVTWCMVEWCTQNLRRNGSISRGTSHATSTERYQYTTSVDINNTRYKRIQLLIQNHMPMCAVSLLESSVFFLLVALYKSYE